jgi:hypothetical protein
MSADFDKPEFRPASGGESSQNDHHAPGARPTVCIHPTPRTCSQERPAHGCGQRSRPARDV